MRAFIAITLSPEICGALQNFQEQLKSIKQDAKWVKPENIHLTLFFLGNIENSLIKKICHKMECVARCQQPFELEIQGTGAFPSLARPRVIWAGVTTGSKKVQNLHELLKKELENLELVLDKRFFLPHVTLGRLRQPAKIKLMHDLLDENSKHLWGRQKVRDIVLMKSELHSYGPVYKAVQRFYLDELNI